MSFERCRTNKQEIQRYNINLVYGIKKVWSMNKSTTLSFRWEWYWDVKSKYYAKITARIPSFSFFIAIILPSIFIKFYASECPEINSTHNSNKLSSINKMHWSWTCEKFFASEYNAYSVNTDDILMWICAL